jgi:hypothetical protein
MEQWATTRGAGGIARRRPPLVGPMLSEDPQGVVQRHGVGRIKLMRGVFDIIEAGSQVDGILEPIGQGPVRMGRNTYTSRDDRIGKPRS